MTFSFFGGGGVLTVKILVASQSFSSVSFRMHVAGNSFSKSSNLP